MKRAIMTLVVIILLGIAFNVVSVGADPAGPTWVYLRPAEVPSLPEGSHFEVSAKVVNVFDLYTWAVRVSFDHNVLACVRVVEGEFLKRSGVETLWVGKIDNETGKVSCGCTVTGNVSGVNDSGTLMTLEFKILESPASSLHIEKTSFISSDKAEIPVSVGPPVGGIYVPLSVLDRLSLLLPAVLRACGVVLVGVVLVVLLRKFVVLRWRRRFAAAMKTFFMVLALLISSIAMFGFHVVPANASTVLVDDGETPSVYWDGSSGRIAYVYDSDLYYCDIPGGTPLNLGKPSGTTGVAFPSIYGDGTACKIACVADKTTVGKILVYYDFSISAWTLPSPAITVASDTVPSMWGDLIVYHDDATPSQVWLFDTSIPQSGTNPKLIGDGEFPDIFHDDTIAFHVYEPDVTQDLDDDGYIEDHVIMWYSISASTLYNTKEVGQNPSVYAFPPPVAGGVAIVIAFITNEGEYGSYLNDDWDLTDDILRYYCPMSAGVISLKQDVKPNSHLSARAGMIAFMTDESRVSPSPADLNGDCDTDDSVVRYFNGLDHFWGGPRDRMITYYDRLGKTLSTQGWGAALTGSWPSISGSLDPYTGARCLAYCAESGEIRYVLLPMPGDVDGDGYVYTRDLFDLGQSFNIVGESPIWDPRADINRDGWVDGLDLLMDFAPAYGSRPGDLNWNAQCDFNRDEIVNDFDLYILYSAWATIGTNHNFNPYADLDDNGDVDGDDLVSELAPNWENTLWDP